MIELNDDEIKAILSAIRMCEEWDECAGYDRTDPNCHTTPELLAAKAKLTLRVNQNARRTK